MSIGFIKRVSNSFRMRIVKSGSDANDFSLPQNRIVFDSDAASYLQVYASGTILVSSAGTAAFKIASWPSLGYIPFAWACWKKDNQYIAPVTNTSLSYTTGEVTVAADGLWADTRGFNYPVYLDYCVWRLQAI